MKQRISAEQLNELTPEKKEHLRELWEPQEGDFIKLTTEELNISYVLISTQNPKSFAIHHRELGTYGISKEYCLPLLNIGQMIEILEYKGLYRINPVFDTDVLKKIEGWDIWMNGENEFWGKGKELCDALWEAVKEVL